MQQAKPDRSGHWIWRMFVFIGCYSTKPHSARIVAKWLVTRRDGFWYNFSMLFAFAILAAAMTQLSDVATAVKTDTIPTCHDFCVTGTIAHTISLDGNWYQLLIIDNDIGMKITGTSKPSVSLHIGDIVRLDGFIAPVGQGNVRPILRNIEILGHTDAPAPHEGTAAEIMSGRHDYQRSFLVGEVRNAEPSGTNPNFNYLSLIADGQCYYVPIPSHGAPLAELEALIGSTVRLDGYPDPKDYSFRFLDERRFLIDGLKNIEVLTPPPKDPFACAPPVEKLRHLPPEALSRLGRHKTSGWLTTKWQGRNALLRMHDGRNALIDFASPTEIPRGATIEVIGYPSTDGFLLRLSRAIGRQISGNPFKESSVRDLSEDGVEKILARHLFNKDMLQGKRLRLCGTIADFGEEQLESKTLPLAIAGRLLDVDFSSVPESCDGIVPGCKIRVAGTCVLATENWTSLSTGTTLNGIRLVVDRPDDVEILARPPWWNLTRLSVVVAVLVLFIAAILFWNRELRKLSEKRGRELFHERSASALAELKTAERTRLAADIHDSISQILTGASMQLDAGETNAAKRILASCRRELRACLWDLRNHALDAENFADAVRETIAPHLGGRAAAIDMDIRSEKMSEALRHAALCITREATVNAIRHGRAETIEIAGRLDGGRLSFSVTDDGRGFDPAGIRGSKDGHFGILGIRERAKAFNGSVEIKSAPGKGTTVSVVLEEEKAT